MNSSAEVPKKKAYSTPSLKTYGSLTDMTASTGNMGKDDNVIKGKNHKTG
jgi:hypothetical protein